ncbi:MAG: hypothetical protein CRN43_02135 [Candidatus Nephrothrix sp. EaCA]|nr:MAG: hypothetical protein CRN43_02135 [Candidatus Nephrothrix sp. EaCA]
MLLSKKCPNNSPRPALVVKQGLPNRPAFAFRKKFRSFFHSGGSKRELEKRPAQTTFAEYIFFS